MGNKGSKGKGRLSNYKSNEEPTKGSSDDGGANRGGVKAGGGEVVLPRPHGDDPCCGISRCNASHPDEFITVGDDKKANLINWKTGAIVQTWSGHEKCVNKAVHGNSTDTVFTASRDMTVKVWSRESTAPRASFAGHELTIAALDITSDDKLLVSGSRDYSVRVWDIATSKQIHSRKISLNMVTCVQWIKNSRSFVQGSEDLKVRVWDHRDGSLNASVTLEGYIYFPLDLDLNDDGHTLLTSSKGFNSVGCEGRIWDLRTQKQLLELNGHEQDVWCCRILHPTKNGKQYVATASKDRTIRVWDQLTGVCVSQIQELDSGAFTGLDIGMPDSGVDLLASAFNGSVYAYKLTEDGKLQCVARSALKTNAAGDDLEFSSI